MGGTVKTTKMCDRCGVSLDGSPGYTNAKAEDLCRGCWREYNRALARKTKMEVLMTKASRQITPKQKERAAMGVSVQPAPRAPVPGIGMERFLALRNQVVYGDTPLTSYDIRFKTGYRYNQAMTDMLAMITSDWQPDENMMCQVPWPGSKPPWWIQMNLVTAVGTAVGDTWLMTWMHWTWLTGPLTVGGMLVICGINLFTWATNRARWRRRKDGKLR